METLEVIFDDLQFEPFSQVKPNWDTPKAIAGQLPAIVKLQA